MIDSCLASYTHFISEGIRDLPAEQTPKIRPSVCLGGLVNLTMIHPKAEPNRNVPNILTGINHLITIATKNVITNHA